MPKNFAETLKNISAILQNHNPNVILYGPPGTGKTYTAMAVAYYLITRDESKLLEDKKDEWLKELDKYRFNPEQEDRQQNSLETRNEEQDEKRGNWAIVQFHPAYHYDDLIQGIEVQGIEVKEKNGNISYEKVWKILGEMSREALVAAVLPEKLQDYRKGNKDDENKRNRIYQEAVKKWSELSKEDREEKGKEAPPYILIIDEINRANLPAVLGELIYALEYRGEPVKTLYGDELIIPPNLYIIGTMNTADRSAGRIDYAIRRRFTFYPMHAELSYADSEYGRPLMEAVNNFIKENVGLDYNPEDIMIGHTYFMSKKEEKDEKAQEIAYKFFYQVVPLLYEYIQEKLVIPRKSYQNEGTLMSIIVDNQGGKQKVKFKIGDNNWTLKGGKLVDGQPVSFSQFKAALTGRYPLPLALSKLIKESVKVEDKENKEMYERIKQSVIESLMGCEKDECIKVFNNSLKVFASLGNAFRIETRGSQEAYVEGEKVVLKIVELDENGKKLFRLKANVEIEVKENKHKRTETLERYIDSYQDLKDLLKEKSEKEKEQKNKSQSKGSQQESQQQTHSETHENNGAGQ